MKRHKNKKHQSIVRALMATFIIASHLYSENTLAQSGGSASGASIIPGAFRVPSENGALRGDPALAAGALTISIPSPAGVGAFHTELFNKPGPFGQGTALFPTVTTDSLDSGVRIEAFPNGESEFKNFGDKRSLTATKTGFILRDPDTGTTFFEQKTRAGSYAISRVEGLDGTKLATFSYASGASIPSSITINGGEATVRIDQNSAGNITQMSLNGMVTTYSYISSGGSNFLSEVKVDGITVLKLTWESGLPTASVNAYGETEMYAYMRDWVDFSKFVVTVLAAADGTRSTFEYTATSTTVSVDGVAYKYQWAKNPVTGLLYAQAVYRGERLLGTTEVDPFTGKTIAVEDEYGARTSYTWGSRPSAVPDQVTTPDGTSIRFTVNDNGDITSTSVKSPSGFTTTQTNTFDSLRRLTKSAVRDSSGSSSTNTSYTYSGAKLVPDSVSYKESATTYFTSRGLVQSVRRDGNIFNFSATNNGKELTSSTNGIPTTMTRSSNGNGTYSIAMTRPLEKFNALIDPSRRTGSLETFRFARDPMAPNKAVLASLSNAGLMTSAFAYNPQQAWVRTEKTTTTGAVGKNSGTWTTTRESSDGTTTTQYTAQEDNSGSCNESNTCSYAPKEASPEPSTSTQPPTATPKAISTSRPTQTPTPPPTNTPVATANSTNTPVPQPPPQRPCCPAENPNCGACPQGTICEVCKEATL